MVIESEMYFHLRKPEDIDFEYTDDGDDSKLNFNDPDSVSSCTIFLNTPAVRKAFFDKLSEIVSAGLRQCQTEAKIQAKIDIKISERKRGKDAEGTPALAGVKA